MKVIADENMPGLEVLETRMSLQRLPGRAISRAQLVDADALLVRSVTEVNEALLAGTAVRFVGSATIGTDHVDRHWLQRQGIGFAHAPGCNARAVAEYVLQVVLAYGPAELEGATAAVVGAGNVGRQVITLLDALGMQVLVVDPPLQRQGRPCAAGRWATLDEALSAEVITLHVPLSGVAGQDEDGTFHLLDGSRLARLSAGQLLVNTCRGAVVDGEALYRRLERGDGPAVVLDVWEGEPTIDARLARTVMLGSPHVAGYSVEGKYRGTAMVVAALERALKLGLPSVEVPQASFMHEETIDSSQSLLRLLRDRHDLRRDHALLLESLASASPGQAFDELRRRYPLRHECGGGRVAASTGRWQAVLSALGLTVY